MNDEDKTVRSEVIGNATLYQGDCFDFIAQFDDIDIVITDTPPATIWSEQHFKRYIDLCLSLASEWVITTGDPSHLIQYVEHEKFLRLGVWSRTNPAALREKEELTSVATGLEPVLIMNAGNVLEWNKRDSRAKWSIPIQDKTELNSRKPLSLASAFVSDFTKPGQVVFDGCMGYGTTGVAAVRKGRNFIGCEIDADRFDIACERIDKVQMKTELALDLTHEIEEKEEESVISFSSSKK